MTLDSIVEELEEKWQQHFRGTDIQHADSIVIDWLRSTLTTFLEEKAQEIEALKWEEPGGSFEGDPVREQWWGREKALSDAASLLRKELNQ